MTLVRLLFSCKRLFYSLQQILNHEVRVFDQRLIGTMGISAFYIVINLLMTAIDFFPVTALSCCSSG